MNYNLTFEKLKDKEFLKNTNILKISFEYSLAKICKEYSEYTGIKNIASFNTENKFSQEKLLIYPFFISTSNGHSKFLFELFGDFYAPKLGPVSIEIIKYFFIEKKESTYFKFNESNIQVKDDMNKSWDEILNSILQQEINIDNIDYKFKDVFILKDNNIENQLYSGIDSGVKILKEQSGDRFFIFNEYDLLFHSHNYSAYSKKVSSNGKIEYNDIIKDKDKLPFYAN